MLRQYHLCRQLPHALHRGIEIVNLKPQQNAIPIRPVLGIANGTMMMRHLKPVQLHHQHAIHRQPLILRAAVVAFATEQLLIPGAARCDIVHGN